MNYPNPKFTADELVRVFATRWFARDLANETIEHLREDHLFLQKMMNMSISHPTGSAVKIKVPK